MWGDGFNGEETYLARKLGFLRLTLMASLRMYCAVDLGGLLRGECQL